MAQFYGTIRGDRASKAQIGHKFLDVNLSYGSLEDSKLAVNVRINKPSDTGKVTVWVDGNMFKEIS